MSRRERLPIRPAPTVAPRYPRVGVVWSAFAAGTLGGALVVPAAHADCALPSHTGSATPGDPGPADKGHGKKGTAKTPTPPPPRPDLPGKLAAALPPPPLGGEPMAVGVVTPMGTLQRTAPPPTPRGGPIHVTPPLPGSEPAVALPRPFGRPGTPAKKKPEPVGLDGDTAHVGPLRYIHPHGPDEPCLGPDERTGRLVIRFG